MKTLLALLLICLTTTVRADGPVVETLVCIRHGEKPKGGLGQLDCKGLNRSLALPKVLLGKFGTPQFIFAPNPAEKIDKGMSYNYIRPLATIEPTAIRCGLPVNTQFGFSDIKGLAKELGKDRYSRATIFVAWEHVLLDDFAKTLVRQYGGDSNKVPAWPGKDFDTIFVFKITRIAGHPAIDFTIDHENLNNVSDDCPD